MSDKSLEGLLRSWLQQYEMATEGLPIQAGHDKSFVVGEIDNGDVEFLRALAVQLGALERQAFIIADGNAEWREENELLHARIEALEAALREIDRLTEDYPDHYLGQIARATLTPEDTDD